MDIDRDAARFAAHQRALLTRPQARGVGFTDKAIQHRVETGRWGLVHPGVYRVEGAPASWEQTVLAAVLAAGDGAIASHRAAAAMWGIEGIERVIELTVPLARRPTVRGAVVHRTDGLLLPERTRLRHVPLTTPARTVFDLASVIPRGALDRVVEDVLSRRLLPRKALVAQLAAHGGPGRRKTLALQALLEEHPERWERADGRLERRLLRFLKARGFPEPVLQYEVRLANGRSVFIDAAYPDRLVGLEANSYLWHTSRPDWVRNQVKTRALTAMGWAIIPVTWEDLVPNATTFEEELRTALWSSTRP
ncbi:MAG: hypothetical protein JO086_06785 [Acidimicrobiia bacterium]|nr:hypothetical protein [Acidimicrobiia bacterium]